MLYTHAEGKKIVEYSIRQSKRARRLRIAVYPGGLCIVTIPSSLKESVASDFIKKKFDWVFEKIQEMKLLDPLPKKVNSRKEYLQNKDRALSLVRARTKHFNSIYNYLWKSVSIRNQKTRWGSCSKRGGLSFNYRIALIPKRLADYIVVHEMCHLAEFNHGANFWKLVSRAIPDYKELRGELRKIGIRMQ